ncbi:MAG: Ig-like domain-containing protein, partial [Desulfitobacteriaceae bacterium]
GTSNIFGFATCGLNGYVTGHGGGVCTITANDSVTGLSKTAVLTVLPVLRITSETVTIYPGANLQYHAQLVYYNESTTDITSTATWVSSNIAVATINSSGLATGVGGGTTTITVTDSSTGVTGTVMLTVLPTLSITPASISIAPGTSQQFTVQLIYADGTQPEDVTNRVTWTSNNFGIATCGLNGYVTGHGGGVCTITANDSVTGLSKAAVLTVLPAMSITSETATISPGANLQYHAQLVYYNGSTMDIMSTATWDSSNIAVATINSGGLATGVGGGTSTITVTDTVTGISGTVTLTVLPTMSISPATATISPGGNQQFSAQLVYADRPSTDITNTATWLSSNTGVATIDTVIKGNVTGVGGGTSTITVTDPATNVCGTVTLTVLPTMSITPVTASISPGGYQQFSAQLVYADRPSTDITNTATWVSSNIGVATINSSGLATGVGGGTSTITVTDMVTGVSATTNLTVLPNIIVTPASATISQGAEQQFSAQLAYADGTKTDITNAAWVSSDPRVATIDASGKASGVGGGASTITVTDPATMISTSVTLTVQPTLSITPDSATIHLLSTQQYSTYLYYADGHSEPITGSRVTWTSSNSNIVSIDSNGLATGLAAGTSTVTAHDSVSNTTNSVNLTVTDAMTLIVQPVPPSTTAIFVGDEQQFSAKLQFGDGSTTDVTSSVSSWASSSTLVATINEHGLVTGVASGTSSISAKVTFNGKEYSGTYSLTVFPPKGGVILEWEK